MLATERTPRDITVRAESLPMEAPAPTTILEVIARAASDPGTDVDKLDKLLGLYERMNGMQARQAYDGAMSAAQAEMRPIAANETNPQTRSKYASFPALDRAMRPIYTRHGFGLSYDTGEGAAEGYVRVVCRVSHMGGDTREHHIDMPADGKGAKGGEVMTKTHATGAALTYGQRYLLKLIFNIAVGEDTDGNGPPASEAPAVAAALRAIAACKTEADLRAWHEKNSAMIQALPSEQHDAIVRAFNARRRELRSAK